VILVKFVVKFMFSFVRFRTFGFENFPKGFRARHFGVGGVGGKNGNE
jgi:hypothetical protein